jgi:glycosyltransferase involved in cell wall biosynthesis
VIPRHDRTDAASAHDASSVTVVVLARNEERTIVDVVRAAAPWCREVLVMDGRSQDATREKARAAGARVVSDPGRGKGAAIRASLTVCSTRFLVFMDADGSHDALDIPVLVSPLAAGEATLCVGSRFAGGSDELSVSVGQLVRTIGNILMNIAINTRWNVQLTDTLNGFRAIHRDAALEISLHEDTHTIEQEMVMKCLRHGHSVVNVPAHEYRRLFGESHIRIWREWPTFVWCVLVNIFVRDVRPRQGSSTAPPRSTEDAAG